MCCPMRRGAFLSDDGAGPDLFLKAKIAEDVVGKHV